MVARGGRGGEMEGKTKGSQLNKACLSRALKATVREREKEETGVGGEESERPRD